MLSTSKLALVVRGFGSNLTLLDSYSVERSEIGSQVLADAERLTEIAMIKNHMAETVRNFIAHHMLGLAAVQEKMASKLSEISIGYPRSPLNGLSVNDLAGPAVGQRLRPAGDAAPVGAGASPLFAIFAAADDGAREIFARHAAVLESAVRPPIDPKGIWLVRPDGYVALVARAGEWAEVARYLDWIAPDR